MVVGCWKVTHCPFPSIFTPCSIRLPTLNSACRGVPPPGCLTQRGLAKELPPDSAPLAPRGPLAPKHLWNVLVLVCIPMVHMVPGRIVDEPASNPPPPTVPDSEREGSPSLPSKPCSLRRERKEGREALRS